MIFTSWIQVHITEKLENVLVLVGQGKERGNGGGGVKAGEKVNYGLGNEGEHYKSGGC